MKQFDMDALAEAQYGLTGQGLPDGVVLNDEVFKVNGTLYATTRGANSPSLRSCARFVSGGFKPGNDPKIPALLFQPGTVIEIPAD